jgi:hypothetical protein
MKEELQKYISNSLEILEHTLIELQSSGKNQFIKVRNSRHSLLIKPQKN